MHDINALKQWGHLADGADYVEVKAGEGSVDLKTFVAAFMSYRPGWMVALWRVRVWLLRVLGQGEREAPGHEKYFAETLPVAKGEKAGFFTVVASDGETHWFVEGSESHLEAMLGVVAEPLERPGMKRFHVITVVRHHNWAGPIYFAVIKPFHHLVVHFAMRRALGAAPPEK